MIFKKKEPNKPVAQQEAVTTTTGSSETLPATTTAIGPVFTPSRQVADPFDRDDNAEAADVIAADLDTVCDSSISDSAETDDDAEPAERVLFQPVRNSIFNRKRPNPLATQPATAAPDAAVPSTTEAAETVSDAAAASAASDSDGTPEPEEQDLATVSEAVLQSAPAPQPVAPACMVAKASAAPAEPHLPAAYFLSSDGSLFRKTESGDNIRITVKCPLWPVSVMRTVEGKQWSLQMRYQDADGKGHEVTFAMSEVLTGKGSMVAKLADTGLQIAPGMVTELLCYIQACHPDQRVIVTSQAGWLDSEHKVFVTPHEVIGDTGSENVVLRQEANSPTMESVHGAGTLEQWQDIPRLITDYPLAIFALLVAFVGPLLKLLRLDGGGFHFFGASSRGKTTLLQIVASVWGKGSDPTRDSKSFVQRWLLTANALEAMASCHSDMAICLDEIGSFTAGDLGLVVYMLAGGSGKAAMNSHRQLVQTRAWSSNIVSSGEKTIADAIQEGGKTAKAGHLLRIIDILAGDTFAGGDDRDSGAVVNRLKELCASAYGTAGTAFIGRLITEISANPDYLDEVRAAFDLIVRELTPAQATPEQGRAIRKFAAAELAGSLAARFGILPFTQEQIRSAVLTVLDSYLSYSPNVPDSQRGLLQLREFLVRNHAALPAVSDPKAKGSAIKGFRSSSSQYLFTDEQLGAASGVGTSGVQELAKALKAQGFLTSNESGRMKSKFKLASAGGQYVRFYAIKASLLEADLGGEEVIAPQADQGTAANQVGFSADADVDEMA